MASDVFSTGTTAVEVGDGETTGVTASVFLVELLDGVTVGRGAAVKVGVGSEETDGESDDETAGISVVCTQAATIAVKAVSNTVICFCAISDLWANARLINIAEDASTSDSDSSI